MPLEVDTRRTFPYVLVEDRPLPADRQRTLHFRHVSARDYARIEQAFTEAFVGGVGSTTVMVAKVLDGVRVALTGWTGFLTDDEFGDPLPYDPAELDAVLELGDVMQLHSELRDMIVADEAARKKAAWQWRSGTAASADGTAPAAV